MAIFIWDDSYKTGIESIDIQHKKLVDLLNQLDESLNIAKVNDALCQGCGSCAAACPSSTAKVGHFTDNQVMHELEELL